LRDSGRIVRAAAATSLSRHSIFQRGIVLDVVTNDAPTVCLKGASNLIFGKRARFAS